MIKRENEARNKDEACYKNANDIGDLSIGGNALNEEIERLTEIRMREENDRTS